MNGRGLDTPLVPRGGSTNETWLSLVEPGERQRARVETPRGLDTPLVPRGGSTGEPVAVR